MDMSMEVEPQQKSINEQLKQEILAMVKADQSMRMGHEWDSKIDVCNTERMKEILKQNGWPGISLVDAEGAEGAWLLLQHADHDIEFQKQGLALLQQAVKKSEAEKWHEAYLTDRVRINSGESQIFGTQFYKDKDGKFVPRPIQDLEGIEVRRKEFGLGLFSEYVQQMQKHKKSV
jgi:hypothetical protein